MQIIVLGMHRSGTSLMTRLINMMGAYFGPPNLALGANTDNPKGFWERTDVLDINRALLALHRSDWANTAAWPLPHRPVEVPPPLLQRMQAVVREMDAHAPWVVKDPRLCLTLPYWKKLLEKPVCVIAYRDPREVAESLHRRDKMSAERGLALWECYAVGLLGAAAGLPCVYAAHEDFLREPVEATGRLYQALTIEGLHLPDAREITAFVDPKLYRSKPSAAYVLSEYQQALVGLLRGKSPPQLGLTVSEASQTLLERPFATPYP